MSRDRVGLTNGTALDDSWHHWFVAECTPWMESSLPSFTSFPVWCDGTGLWMHYSAVAQQELIVNDCRIAWECYMDGMDLDVYDHPGFVWEDYDDAWLHITMCGHTSMYHVDCFTEMEGPLQRVWWTFGFHAMSMTRVCVFYGQGLHAGNASIYF